MKASNMMDHFEVINGLICVVDASRCDYFYGFRRTVVKVAK
jgi:hypothetical protein